MGDRSANGWSPIHLYMGDDRQERGLKKFMWNLQNFELILLFTKKNQNFLATFIKNALLERRAASVLLAASSFY